jgi:ubiquinone/menaquinone biosynthesis C-methylase UbiE
MSLTKYFASQLRQPSGLFGRYVMPGYLNRHNDKLNSFTFKSLLLQPDDQVLEVGFGGGALISKIVKVVTEGHITGVDLSNKAVEACSKRFESIINKGLMDLHCASVDELPLAADIFTKVCAVNAIYFWPNPVSSLQQIRRVLRQNGLIIIGFKARSVLEKHKVTQNGFSMYESNQVEALLKEAGFRDVRCNFEGSGDEQCIAAEGRK